MMQPRMKGHTMKYIATIAVLMMLAVPAQANNAGAHPVMAKTSADQRALAQSLAGRIQSALDADPFTAEKNCKGENCTASAH